MANQVNKQNPMEVYYRFDSFDCDQVVSSVAYRFDSEAEAEAYIDSFYDNAEAGALASPLTEEEYINFSPSSHDIIEEVELTGNFDANCLVTKS
ncbi:hypothetical protein [Vibrio cincinnatiensis]|uniref:hypothetical protein n=1 Tax=Vibrio cincinnatiensis TaxID=675 RepID=UPI001EDFD290|nr:hypothetical protein [Vibrio cincinnatiensis]MCG3741596.1 hypothetical protein [Vibrio cincinnatiensis]